MRSNLLLQLSAAVVCIVSAIAFLNPFHVLMTDMAHMAILGLLAVTFSALAVFILLEQGGDERETAHRSFAGRMGFLAGALFLLLAIVWQAFHGPVDPWLLIALCAMVAGKSLARLYSMQWL